jgi:hypothetical protein
MVIPILLYGSEIWGIESVFKNSGSAPYGKFHIQFLKHILGDHCKTSNNACYMYSELGRLPVRSKIIMFAIKYLDHSISLVHDIFMKTKETNTWSMHIKTCLNNLGFSYLANFNVSLKPVLGIVKGIHADIKLFLHTDFKSA